MAVSLSSGFLLSFLFCSLICPSSHGASPTISHANEPFVLPQSFPTCLYNAFRAFISTVPPQESFKAGSSIEREASCGANDTVIALRLRLLDGMTKVDPSASLETSFAGLLEEFRRTLKLRYKWAVIMRGHFWMEYQSRTAQWSSPLKLNDATEAGKMMKEKKGDDGHMRLARGGMVEELHCLSRGDVLVSSSRNGTDADDGFDVLTAPHAIVAQNRRFYATMQEDCNLVLYEAAGYPLWSSRSDGKGRKCRMALLRDGNLVIENENNVRVWASGSSVWCASVFVLSMQSDGNLVIYDILSGMPIWATGTNK